MCRLRAEEISEEESVVKDAGRGELKLIMFILLASSRTIDLPLSTENQSAEEDRGLLHSEESHQMHSAVRRVSVGDFPLSSARHLVNEPLVLALLQERVDPSSIASHKTKTPQVTYWASTTPAVSWARLI